MKLLKSSIDCYVRSKGGQTLKVPMNMDFGAPTPTFSLSAGDPKMKPTKLKKKMDFNDETVMKALQKNNDQQWEETCVLLIQTFLRSVKKYSAIEGKDDSTLNSVWS